MIWGLIAIIGAYGLAAAILHAVYAVKHPQRSGEACTTFLLITCNNELQVEWYLRSLLFVSRLRGRKIQIAVSDEGSEDETLAIVRRLAAGKEEGVVRILESTVESYLTDHPNDPIVIHRIPQGGNGEGLAVLWG
ncbi:MAG: hypothetical protein K0Q90_4690 [Paenibacillaceae bacterium]|nr:hypothetical protein [Paenibacillaceae bacterium]